MKRTYKGIDWYVSLCNYYACKLGQEENGFCKKHNKMMDKNGDINER